MESASHMEYLKFDIRLPAAIKGEQQKVIIESVAGRAESAVALPLHDATFQDNLERLRDMLLKLKEVRPAIRSTDDQDKSARAVGNMMFTALFHDETLHLYDESVRKATALPNVGLLLRFEIAEPTLATLPWELLYDARGGGRFISCYNTTPIVRALPPPYQQVPPPVTTQPLRMLCMVANPNDHSALNIEDEEWYLNKALQKLIDDGTITITRVKGHTWRDLQNWLLDDEWHIFHFIGHGGYEERPDGGTGVLAFENENDGKADIVTAAQVSHLLDSKSTLRLVVLNACEGARGNTRDIFSSTATTLLSQCHHLAAVLAMQYEITDKAAIAFTRTFYTALAAPVPVPVESAVTAARVAIDLEVRKTLEWGTPVLYTRSQHSVLFTFPPQARRTPLEPQPPVGTGYTDIAQGPPPMQEMLPHQNDSHAKWVSAVAWSPDGSRIASSGGDGTVRIVDPNSGNELLTYKGHAGPLSEVLTVAWSPDSTRIASGGNRGTIQVWKASNKQKLAEYTGHPSFRKTPYVTQVCWAAWSPDGSRIASACISLRPGFNFGLDFDKAVHIWNPTTEKLVLKINLRTSWRDISSAGGIAWSPDGSRIAAGITGETRIYNAVTGTQLLSYKQQSGYITTVAWSPDGSRIASLEAKSVHVWNATTGEFLYAYRDHSISLRDVAWSPNGQYLASSSNDHTAHIWTADNGTRIFTYKQHDGEVGAISWSPDSRRIASVSKDKTVHIWQAI